MRRYRTAVHAALAAAVILALPLPVQAQEKINSVSVRIESEDFDEWGRPELTASTKSGHYTVGNIESAYEHFDSSTPGTYEEDTDIYVIELYADDGYYFNITKADKIHITGLGADFIKASRQNNGSDLILTVRLKNLERFVGEIEDAKWDQQGFASWDEAFGAQSYMLDFYNEKGRSKRVETCGTTYDFRPFMQRPGDYSYRVRPLSSTRESGDWIEAGSITINEAAAENNRQMFQIEKEVSYKDGIVVPSNEIVVYKNIGWQESEDGRRWYRNQDASYPQNMWMQDNDAWYYFGSDGYCKAGEYLTYGGYSYYFNEDGKMITNAKAPDGRKADATGKLSSLK